MTTYTPPRFATYRPDRGPLCFTVLVLAERRLFGRHEYQIQSPAGQPTMWITDRDGQQLQFEEGTP